MYVPLTLGDFLFTDFAIPEKINFGGQQVLVTHKLPGGQRIIDAMGRDDADIKWSGRFRGFDAEIQAQTLDQMRVAGQPLTLTWSLETFTVLIAAFDADFSQPFEIPYSITCMVIQDDSSPLLPSAITLDQSVGDDLTNIVSLAADLGNTAVSTAIGAVQTAAGAIQTFQGVSSSDVSSVQTAIGSAQTATTAAIATGNGTVAASGSVAGMVGGQPPATLASGLLAQSSAFSSLGMLYQVQSSLGRMSVNITNGVG